VQQRSIATRTLEPAAPTQLRLFAGEATELEPGGAKPSNRHAVGVAAAASVRGRRAMKIVRRNGQGDFYRNATGALDLR
jgi:hypothetical protein